MNETPAHAPQQGTQTAGSGNSAARGVFRFREYTLGPDRRSEAAPVAYEMDCASCFAYGPVSADATDGTVWALQHLKENPTHLDYREHIARPYRAEPGAWL